MDFFKDVIAPTVKAYGLYGCFLCNLQLVL